MAKRPLPSLSSLRDKIPLLDPIQAWSMSIRDRVREPAFQADGAFIKRLVPLMETFNRYFDSEVRGQENLITDGPALIIGNHSGGVLTPDTSALLAAWYRTCGFNNHLYGLAFDAAFGIPGFSTLMRKIGQLPASHQNARAALRNGHSLLVYPGGVHEVFRPYGQRNKIDFAGHKGFIRLALREGVPIVPVVGHGGHETTIVLSRGESIAEKLGMNRLRMNQYPILLQFPWGISTPGQPGIPLPAKITMQVCEPLDWSHLGPEAADNEEIVHRCYNEVTQLMQETLTRLAQENPKPLSSRVASIIRGQKASSQPIVLSAKQEVSNDDSHIYPLTISDRQTASALRSRPTETRQLRKDKPVDTNRRVG